MCPLSCWVMGLDHIGGWIKPPQKNSRQDQPFRTRSQKLLLLGDSSLIEHTSDRNTAYMSLWPEKYQRPSAVRIQEGRIEFTVAEIRPQSMKSPRVLWQELSLRLKTGVRIPVLRRHLSYQPRPQPTPQYQRSHAKNRSCIDDLEATKKKEGRKNPKKTHTTNPPKVSVQHESVKFACAPDEHDKIGSSGEKFRPWLVLAWLFLDQNPGKYGVHIYSQSWQVWLSELSPYKSRR